MKKVTFAIAGFGDRGSTYASMQNMFSDRMQIVAVADLKPERVALAKQLYNISTENCFSSAEKMLRQEKLADVMIVSTMDRQHADQAKEAIKRGYHILLEKPISPEISKCRELLEVSKQSDRHVIVCHVLRYTAFYNKIRNIIEKGGIGEVVSVCANENVGYWHQAHSFVRGNWRNSADTSPMILQKSCHDMDILLWATGKKCASLSSVGNIYEFKKEKAPAGAAKRCLDGCMAKETCVFDAEKIYIESESTGIRKGNTFFSSIVAKENTEASVYEALKTGPYGRCVYHCDNDVADHQHVEMLMTDGSTLSFTMCAFTENCYRYFKAMGTKGEIEADMQNNKIYLRVFGKGEDVLDVNLLEDDLKGHGGGDSAIISDYLDLLLGNFEILERTTTLEASMESHYIALAAEESRLQNGKRIDMVDFRAN